ncbi:hydrogenase subunit MbhD domain-containing protein [Spirochaeta africana]|uniref:Putative subunit of the multisubunit Na+/H+ antiporter n=1 Tax=Spirochaeta africana (strain ATCC 700263 / DSM 8902 / Z-7692) TaxID=889378 RepID=H9ULG3_SPIAZ|nr:hydrogenase subunit MbhD domain-containing protein [Spirochaeta africana]AFG38356.1 putative subunit of the multisubunit Na+/H+ antiporter [Spirochaeta africana DSM 8902]
MSLEIPFLIILCCIVITAFAAVQMRGHITSIIVLSVFSILSTVVFAVMQAVDVAMAEAVIGAGLMTALFVTAISKTRRSR